LEVYSPVMVLKSIHLADQPKGGFLSSLTTQYFVSFIHSSKQQN